MLVVAFLFRNNETILLRLKGGTTYRQNEEFDPNVLTSYRLDIYGFTLLNLANDGMPAVVFGQGRQRAQKLMGKILELGVAHNRFIEILQYGGVLALLFFIGFIYALWRIIKNIKLEVIS